MESGLSGRSGQTVARHVEEEYSHATGPVPTHLLHTVERSATGPRMSLRLVTPQNVQVGSIGG